MFKKIKRYFQDAQAIRYGTLARWQGLRRLLEKEIAAGTLLLDIGSFDGFIAAALKTRAARLQAVVVDSDPSGLHTAGRHGLHALHASALRLPIKERSIDAVLCLDVIEHIKEDGQLAAEIGRVLKAGGKMILTTPMQGGVSFPFMSKQRAAAVNREWGHVRPGYSLEELADSLGKHDLCIEKRSRYFNVFTRLGYRLAVHSKIPIRGSGFLYKLLVLLEPLVKWGAQEHIIVARKE